MMREPVDLRRAVKEAVGEDLADLTFTPAMQQRVLAQIHKRPRSRLTWLYPASAAAAVLLILVTSTSYLRQDRADQKVAASGGAPQEATSAPVAPAGAESMNAATATAATPAPPEQRADRSTDGVGNSAAGVPAPEIKAFGGPGINAMMMGKLAPTGPQMAAVPSEHLVVTLTGGAVTRIDVTGAPVWQVALPTKAEQIVAAPNGKLVVGAGSTTLLLGPDSSTLESLQLKEPVLQIVTGPSDQLALISEQAVYVRRAAGQPPVAIREPNVSAGAFSPDGLLLLATPEGLAAYGPNGNRRWLATGDGGPLLVGPVGKMLVWGDKLYRYDSTGAEASALEPAVGTIAGGPGLLRWDGERLKGINWAGKQAWTWQASGWITAVYQGEGDRVLVVLDTPDGVVLQELQGATGRPVGKLQSLPWTPLEGAIVDGQLYLRLPEGITVLPL